MSDSSKFDELDEADWERLARYLAGESAPEEAAAVAAWAAEDPSRAELLTTLDTALGRYAAGESSVDTNGAGAGAVDAESFPSIAPAAEVDVEAALALVRARMSGPRDSGEANAGAHEVGERSTAWSPAVFRAAAVVLILVAAAVLFSRLRPGPGEGDLLAGRAAMTGPGEIDTLRLSDGTNVVLGPGTELLVVEGFGEGHRIVELRGEAFFAVSPAQGANFAVRAGDVVVEDLGTAFSVRSVDPSAVGVGVTEGAVALRVRDDPAEGVTLRAGERAEVLATGEVLRSQLDPDWDLGWRDGTLAFREAPLARVAADLRRWYGAELVVPDTAMRGRHLTASFRGETLEQVARVIALAIGGVAEIRGDTVSIRPAPAPATRAAP